MSELADKIGRALFPEKSRRFLTFRWATIFVAILVVWNLALSFALKPAPQPPPQFAGWFNFWRWTMQSPVFIVLLNAAYAVGFAVIYMTRTKPRYYAARAVFYGMLLGGVAGELLYFGQLYWRH